MGKLGWVLSVLVVWGFGLSAQEVPIRESFSLRGLLKELGYGPSRSEVIPIRSGRDLKDSLAGRVPEAGAQMHHEYLWPFSQVAVSPNLSMMAVSLDPRAFPSLRGSHAVTALVAIPDSKEAGSPRILWQPSFPRHATVSSLSFLSENLVRAGLLLANGSDPLVLGYRLDYVFFDVTRDRPMFSIREDLAKFGTVQYVRHYSNRFYIVATSRTPEEVPTEADLVFHVIDYDPITHEAKSLWATRDARLGRILLHNPVDEPGRDITVKSNGMVLVRFSSYEAGKWVGYQLTIDQGGAKLEPVKPAAASGYQPIVNTDEFFVKESDAGFEIARQDQGGKFLSVFQDTRISPYQNVYQVTKGFLGVEANHPQYSTYLYVPGRGAVRLLEPRLVKAEYLDGGFAGLSMVNPATGDVTLVRVIYDSESLNEAETKGMQVASRCADDLIEKVRGRFRSQKD